jgi:hypothetical protein
MAVDPKKHQKKLAKLAAKRKAKHEQLTREKHAGLPERMASAASYPILESWASEDLWTTGIGYICLSRQLPKGFVAAALFLLDRYCLGVKNVAADVSSRFDYDSRCRKLRAQFTLKDLAPETARKLVEDSVAYAASLGLHPHVDYQKAKLIFGDIDARQSQEELEFGREGKPFFISGPNDTPQRCRQIIAALEEHCGRGGYDYLVNVADPSEVFPGAPNRGNNRIIALDEEDADSEEEAIVSDSQFPAEGPTAS